MPYNPLEDTQETYFSASIELGPIILGPAVFDLGHFRPRLGRPKVPVNFPGVKHCPIWLCLKWWLIGVKMQKSSQHNQTFKKKSFFWDTLDSLWARDVETSKSNYAYWKHSIARSTQLSAFFQDFWVYWLFFPDLLNYLWKIYLYKTLYW